MMEETAFLFSLDLSQVLFPLGFKELVYLKAHILWIILFNEFQGCKTLVEVWIINFTSKDKSIVLGGVH